MTQVKENYDTGQKKSGDKNKSLPAFGKCFLPSINKKPKNILV